MIPIIQELGVCSAMHFRIVPFKSKSPSSMYTLTYLISKLRDKIKTNAKNSADGGGKS